MKAWLNRLSRATAGPMALRGVVFLASWIGIWLAAPAQAATPKFALLTTAAALIGALAPGSRLVDVVMVGIVALWGFATLGLGEPADPVRTFATAGALYLVHSAAAVAALLPYDAVVDAQVLLRWAARSALVLAAAGLVTVVVVLLAPVLTPTTSILALLVGLSTAAGTIALLASRAKM